MTLRDYLIGVAFFSGTAGAVGISAWLLICAKLDHLEGVARGLAFATMVTAGLIFVHLLPGALTILTRGTVLGTALVGLVICALLARRSIPPHRPERLAGHAPGLPHRRSLSTASAPPGADR